MISGRSDSHREVVGEMRREAWHKEGELKGERERRHPGNGDKEEKVENRFVCVCVGKSGLL